MSTADVATNTTPEIGAYEARRSNKTTHTSVKSDGAVWKERLAVCESVTAAGLPKLTVRSYYRNQTTQERVWDEPPSGASEIIFATSEQRKKADVKKQSMQLTLDEIPSEENNGVPATTTPTPKKPKGWLGRFQKKTKERPQLRDESKDLNLQRAIALSVAEANGKNTAFDADPVILYDDSEGGYAASNDEDLAMALSMSTESWQPTGLSEDEMLQQALEASRLDVMRVPSHDQTKPAPRKQRGGR